MEVVVKQADLGLILSLNQKNKSVFPSNMEIEKLCMSMLREYYMLNHRSAAHIVLMHKPVAMRYFQTAQKCQRIAKNDEIN